MKRREQTKVGLIWTAGLALLAGCWQQQRNESVVMIEVEADPSANASEAAPAVAPRVEEVRAVELAGLLPPRAEVVPASRVEGAIAFAYRSPDPPTDVARWYRAAGGLNLHSEMDEGGEHVLSGTTARPAGDFSVRLAAQSGGGTTAMVLVTPRR